MRFFETIGSAIVIAYDDRPVLTTDAWVDGDAYFGSWGLDYEIPAAQMHAILEALPLAALAAFADSLQRQRSETAHLVQQRQDTHTARFGEPMTDDNIWLSGRKQELAALDELLRER